jgi:serine/threonine protein kinase
MKAKVIAGIVLGLRFAHSLGLAHGHLTASRIVFDSDYRIQIVDFERILMEAGTKEDEEETNLGGFSRSRWTPKTDIQAFASMLFEIIVAQQRAKNLSSLTFHHLFPA